MSHDKIWTLTRLHCTNYTYFMINFLSFKPKFFRAETFVYNKLWLTALFLYFANLQNEFLNKLISWKYFLKWNQQATRDVWGSIEQLQLFAFLHNKETMKIKSRTGERFKIFSGIWWTFKCFEKAYKTQGFRISLTCRRNDKQYQHLNSKRSDWHY